MSGKLSIKYFPRNAWFLLAILFIFNGCRSVLIPPALAQSNKDNALSTGQRIRITENGKSRMPIILPAHATPRNDEAAKDLANYIKKISGAEPEIFKGMPKKLPEAAFFIGIQPGLESFFPGIDLTFSHPEEILLTARDQFILIAGRDQYNPEQMEAKDQFNRRTISGIQQEYGTCNAVFTFIQDKLGVRWLWPGALGEEYPTNPNLAIAPFTYRYHPNIRDRSGILYRMSLTTYKGSPAEKDWFRFQRSQLSSLDLFRVHHAFTEWWGLYHINYPEIFALQPNGKRTYKAEPKYAKLCQSNPLVWELWLKEVDTQIVRNPSQTAFNASANDGWTFGHCTCDNCRAWDGLSFTWGNPNLSDREVHFANILAEHLADKYPGKNYKVVVGAYGYTRPVPEKEKPSSQVIIMNAANFLMRGQSPDENRKLAKEQYAAWGKVTKQMAWRPNIGNPVGGTSGMPDIAPHQAAQDIAFVDSAGCIGLFFDTYWSHWANQGLQYYTLTQCAWNPHLNADSLLSDYYKNAYGSAASTMQQYWEYMGNSRNAFVKNQPNRFRFMNIYQDYDSDWYKKASMLLEKASEEVKNESGKYLKRIDFADFGLRYAWMVVNIRKQMALLEKNPSDKKANDQVLKYWEQMKELEKTAPAYGINFNVTFVKPQNRSMNGLHPFNKINPKALKALKAVKVEDGLE